MSSPGVRPGGRVRVLIADDSPTVRAAMAALFLGEPRIQLVGEASDGAEAVRLAALLQPDVMTMDVNMPVLDGLGATEKIMAASPTRVLLVCALGESNALDLTFRAVAAGALEVVAKPEAKKGESKSGEADRLRKFGRELARAIVLMAEVPVIRRRSFTSSPGQKRAIGRHRIDALGIAASTGGPPALAAILRALPAALPISILIAQHIAHGFGDGLGRWLQQHTPLKITRARDGEACAPGVVYLPPDGCDLLLTASRRLRTPMSSGPHSPSGDALLASLAEALGPRAAGVVLTGMGDDGAQGLLALRRAGAACFAQSEASSAVFGMPRAAFEAGAVQELLSLGQIAKVILELA